MSDVLRRFQELSGHVYVDGAFRQSEGTDGLDVIDPATEAVIGTITNVTPAEIDETVKRANEVQKAGPDGRPWTAPRCCTKSPTKWRSGRRSSPKP